MNGDFSMILGRIFSYTLVHDSFVATVPILYACLCAVVSRQCDITNIAAEGIIMFGAFFGFMADYFTGSWIVGILAGIAIGVIVSRFMAFAYLNYHVNVFVLGLSINMIATSGTRFLLNAVFGANGNFFSDRVVPIPKVKLGIFSGNAVLRSMFSGYVVTEIIVIPIVLIVWFLLYRTVWGLQVRAIGQNELAASTAGVNTKKKKMQALVLSGACAGLGGAHLSIGYSCMFIENMSGGKGFMGMAAMQFGNSNPIAAALGCILFGTSQSIATRVAPWGIPNQFVSMIPYIASVLVLAITVIIQQQRERRANSSLLKRGRGMAPGRK